METEWISSKDGVVKLETGFQKMPWSEPKELFKNMRDQPGLIWLDSGMDHKGRGKWSYIMFNPYKVIHGSNNRYTVKENGNVTSTDHDPFDLIKLCMAKLKAEENTYSIPFTGGICGFFGYELLIHCEPSTRLVSQDSSEEGHLWVGFYHSVFAFNHQSKEVYLIANGPVDKIVTKKLREMKNAFSLVKTDSGFHLPTLTPKSNFTKEEYINAVEYIRQYIAEGDCYQVNLSQRFELENSFDPIEMYLRLRSISPAPFGAYMNTDQCQILSTSPERFLNLHKGRAQTCPIKGTRPRGKNNISDNMLLMELQQSAKDRAENVMIVDLLRNDLSKVCMPSSVVVTNLCKLESFPTVHHLVSTIEGELREGYQATDLLKSAFPGGSVTGAPKIRAMEIINEIEPHPRGVYCGAVGYIGYNSTMDTNIVIRTMVRTEQMAKFHVGGGVTYLSNPEDEYMETLDKAHALMKAIKG
ncbi:MAG TPA: aminodeoxychorismate synthase component I [Nitrospinota bacterium]|nr:aminodeoxychorismate synthase component I [Nitrospinota bacterium]|tara:strand:+ start:4731 stop:6140 length:1410 start_codon:yes stop_codon:yes gene_type:complete